MSTDDRHIDINAAAETLGSLDTSRQLPPFNTEGLIQVSESLIAYLTEVAYLL
jgi:hypothetical protein